MDVNKYNRLKEKDKLPKWNDIIKLYLLDDSPKEINLPYQYKHNLLVKIPNGDVVKKSYKIIYELLLDSYNQFINLTKKQNMSSFANHQGQSLPIPVPNGGRRNSSSAASSGSRRNSVVEVSHSSRRGSSSSHLASGTVHVSRSNSTSAAMGTTPRSGSRRPSLTPEYPKSPINNGTHIGIKSNIVKLPSPSSDVEVKKKAASQSQSLFKMKKFKFRRNSNE
ncbi:hypothetical protein CANTEDRAFT_136722 [Yamadazyma tenuis ATCC 10573]|nr:uncharacterized protein CANTEDRAFT_136722 [Yamadazyma tenuis ATCC 10573]EGV60234.1 hypothetical protein CANTEDRAFT_136722 [Yamadazyma tenuis ATCC 10573]